MAELDLGEVVAWLDALLDAPKFRMEEPENGLIVDTGRPVSRIGAAFQRWRVLQTPFQARRASVL